MPKSEIAKIGNEIKRKIKNRFPDKIIQIRTALNKYGTWRITIYTNIVNDWWVKNLDTNELEHLGKKPYKEIENWLYSNSNYKKYIIVWEISRNTQLKEIENEVEKMIFDKYKDLIGSYYDDFSDKRHLLIVKVNPL